MNLAAELGKRELPAGQACYYRVVDEDRFVEMLAEMTGRSGPTGKTDLN